MASEGTFGPALDIFAGGLSGYIWIIMIVVVLLVVGVVIWWISKFKKKNTQWTHKLNVRVEDSDGSISDKVNVHKMRRWKHKDQKTPPLFELEKPLIGSRIFVELEKYTGATSYEIVLGNDGRIYIPTKTMMCKDKNALEVSVKHAGIDRARQQYSDRFEQMNETASRIDMLTLMKYGLIAMAFILILVLGMTGLKSWGERASYDAASAEAEVRAWEIMAEVQQGSESMVNTLMLMLPDLKNKYGNNIQGAIRNAKEQLNGTG